MSNSQITDLKAVDFFCGAGGMSFGLQQAGINVLAGIDNAADCRRTYEENVKGAKFIKHDISTLTVASLGERLGIRPGDRNLIFAGCSPCQFWSKIRTDKTKSERTAFLLKQFQKFIKHFKPGFVVVENVPGLYRRKEGSILPGFFKFLSDNGYVWSDGVVNANHFGVPQNRMRYLLVATRLRDDITLPPAAKGKSATVRDFIGVSKGFPEINAGHRDEEDFQHWASDLSEENLRRIQATPASGGDRSAWRDDPSLQIPAYEGKNDIFRDVYGRMFWDRPAPTITTRFNSLSNGRFGHPVEHRAISIREGATLQTFPKNFVFRGTNIHQLAKQIGNAVPPELARRIGKHLISLVSNG